MSLDPIERTAAITQEIRNEAAALSEYAYGFEITGNEKMAKTLDAISVRLRNYSNKLQDAVADKIIDEVEKAEQNTANMVNACLAGAFIRKEDKKD